MAALTLALQDRANLPKVTDYALVRFGILGGCCRRAQAQHSGDPTCHSKECGRARKIWLQQQVRSSSTHAFPKSLQSGKSIGQTEILSRKGGQFKQKFTNERK